MALWLDTVMEPLAMFRPRKGFLATPVIIALNTAVWVLMVCLGANFLEPDTEMLLEWGGNLDSRVREGEVWRLLTAVFLHSGIIHLAMNMITLAVIGLELEKRIGSALFTSAYLITGIGASITSATMNDGVVSVGASGAVFGMFGTFLSLLLLNAFHRKVKKNLLWLILGFIAASFFDVTDQGVDHWAHFGGLSGGLVVGLLLRLGIREPTAEEKATQNPHTAAAQSTLPPDPPPIPLETETEDEGDPFAEPPTAEDIPEPIAPGPDLPVPLDLATPETPPDPKED